MPHSGPHKRQGARRRAAEKPPNVLDVDDPRNMPSGPGLAATLRKGERDGSVVRYVPAVAQGERDAVVVRYAFGGDWATEEMITAGARAAHDEVFDALGMFKDGAIRKVKHFDDEGPKVQDRWREITRKVFNAMFPERPTA